MHMELSIYGCGVFHREHLDGFCLRLAAFSSLRFSPLRALSSALASPLNALHNGSLSDTNLTSIVIDLLLSTEPHHGQPVRPCSIDHEWEGTDRSLLSSLPIKDGSCPWPSNREMEWFFEVHPLAPSVLIGTYYEVPRINQAPVILS